MSAIVKKVVSEPAKIVKKTVGALKEPAGSESPYKIAVGVALSPVISWGYGKFYDWVMGFFPNAPNWLKITLKLALPLIPTPIVKTLRIPAGAVINGGLYGVFFLTLFNFLYELITGKALAFSGKTSSASTESTAEVGTSEWGVF